MRMLFEKQWKNIHLHVGGDDDGFTIFVQDRNERKEWKVWINDGRVEMEIRRW